MRTLNIKLDSFEGPMELLFHLIEKNKIDIYDIPIFSLTNQYMAYMNGMRHIDMDSLSEFLVMAATLLEIKSKLLLPLVKTEEDETEEDPRQALVEKLLAYQFFKETAAMLNERQHTLARLYFKKPEQAVLEQAGQKEPVCLDELLTGLDLDKLYALYQDVLSRREMKTDKIRSRFNSVTRDLFTVEDKIKHIQNLLFLQGRVMLSAVFRRKSPKPEKIAAFLAMLEMMKRNEIEVAQERLFADIEIRSMIKT